MPATPDHLHLALTYCLDFARTMLEDAGEFHPFGAIVNAEGKLEGRGAWTGEEHPIGQEVYSILTDAQRAEIRNGHAIASAVAANVDIPDQYAAPYRDGVRITLESTDYSRNIYVPYRLARRGLFGSKRTVEMSEPFAVELRPAV